MTMTSTTSTANLNLAPEDATAQIGGFLREHGEIETILPVAIGVFITSQFKLRGANALLVNLLVASLARQVFTKLKQEGKSQVSQSNGVSTEETEASQVDLQGYAIAHAVPGRVRLKMPQLSLDRDFAKRLQQVLSTDEYVNRVRINYAAASIIINYNNQGLSDWELGMRLMGIINRVRQENQVSG